MRGLCERSEPLEVGSRWENGKREVNDKMREHGDRVGDLVFTIQRFRCRLKKWGVLSLLRKQFWSLCKDRVLLWGRQEASLIVTC